MELAILLAALAYVIERIMDARGWSRSSRLLRQENEDLLRRTLEQDSEIADLLQEVAVLKTHVNQLKGEVSELSKRDQKAVIEMLGRHETDLMKHRSEITTILTEIRNALEVMPRSVAEAIKGG